MNMQLSAYYLLAFLLTLTGCILAVKPPLESPAIHPPPIIKLVRIGTESLDVGNTSFECSLQNISNRSLRVWQEVFFSSLCVQVLDEHGNSVPKLPPPPPATPRRKFVVQIGKNQVVKYHFTLNQVLADSVLNRYHSLVVFVRLASSLPDEDAQRLGVDQIEGESNKITVRGR
jgi:hypothetical protein